jgi:hypothetical protein
MLFYIFMPSLQCCVLCIHWLQWCQKNCGLLKYDAIIFRAGGTNLPNYTVSHPRQLWFLWHRSFWKTNNCATLWLMQHLSYSYNMLVPLAEPVTSTAPRITSVAKFDMIERHLGKPLSLMCQAQGHPVPGFRSVFIFAVNCYILWLVWIHFCLCVLS